MRCLHTTARTANNSKTGLHQQITCTPDAGTSQMPCKAHSANSGSMLGTLCSTAGSRPRLSGVENMAGYSEWIKGSKVPHPVCLIISLATAANVATPFGTLTAYKSGKSQSLWSSCRSKLHCCKSWRAQKAQAGCFHSCCKTAII